MNNTGRKSLIGFILFIIVLPVLSVLSSKFGLDKNKQLKREVNQLNYPIKAQNLVVANQNNQTKSLVQLMRGRVSIVGTFDINCPTIDCQEGIKQLLRVQHEYSDDLDKFQILSFTSLAPTDKPEKLLHFAQKNTIDSTKWQLFNLSAEALNSFIADNKIQKNHVLLLDTSLVIKNTYNVTNLKEVNKLMEHIAIIAPKKAKARIEYQASKPL
jgi:hypothetical protein